ncbi:MAG: shikimate kinase [Thermoguttaceae bacterium]
MDNVIKQEIPHRNKPISFPSENLILVGYRGTGKTTIAQKWGSRFDIPILDSDREIELRVGKNIATIFAEDTEATFRDLEEKVIASLILESRAPFVLSTGGGAILRESTRNLLRESGLVVWLQATPETIWHRIQKDEHSKTMRPQLSKLAPFQEIVTILSNRTHFYFETSHTNLSTEHLTPDEIISAIESFMSISTTSQLI